MFYYYFTILLTVEKESLGLEADKQAESSVEPVTNTTANLSNPITKSNDTAGSAAGTPDIDTAMPGGFVGGIASAGTGGKNYIQLSEAI